MATPAPVFVIFGITGDLSKRKLLPVLYHLFSQELLPSNTRIIGVSRSDLNIDELLSTVELCVLEKDSICKPEGLARLRAALESFKLDPSNSADFSALRQRLDELDENGEKHVRIFYMAIPPSAYGPIVEHLGIAGLNDDRARLLLEKPFGYDLTSAGELISLVDKYFSEDTIFRIDHYLAKETAQNLLAFRASNSIFSTLWNNEHIERVLVRSSEKIGIEGRADFYEKTGALRDIIQSHLLQLLTITLMDLPTDMSSTQIHRSKQYFLEQLLPADPTQALRAQYDSYRAEVNNPGSNVETFVRLHLQHSAERWQGVDIVLETGKAMQSKETEVTIVFKSQHDHPANNLHFRIQPNEGISLDLVVKMPGYENNMHNTSLDFAYEKVFQENEHIDAYERVVMDAVRGDQALFASNKEVLATWRVLQPLLDAWQGSADDLKFYPSGQSSAQLVS